MTFEVLTFDLAKNSWAIDGLAVYEKKIKAFEGLKITYLKVPAKSRKNQMEAKRISSEKLLAAMDPHAFKICFDERGDVLSSEKFSKRLSQALESGKQKTQFIIGGPYGLDLAVRNNCQMSISLSSLVMNQEVALLVAMEQVYRAFTIRHGLPYHNI